MSDKIKVTVKRELKDPMVGQAFINIIKRAVKATLKYEKIGFKCKLDVTVTDENKIAEINLKFRGQNKKTDVLSFPMHDFLNGTPLFGVDDELFISGGEIFLGDIVLSYTAAFSQAEEYGHSTEREFAYLSVHSALHILGYDHERGEKDKMLMRQKEEEILSVLSLER